MFSVLVDIPGYVFCMVVMECWGQRPILSICQVRAAQSVIIIIIPPYIPLDYGGSGLYWLRIFAGNLGSCPAPAFSKFTF